MRAFGPHHDTARRRSPGGSVRLAIAIGERIPIAYVRTRLAVVVLMACGLLGICPTRPAFGSDQPGPEWNSIEESADAGWRPVTQTSERAWLPIAAAPPVEPVETLVVSPAPEGETVRSDELSESSAHTVPVGMPRDLFDWPGEGGREEHALANSPLPSAGDLSRIAVGIIVISLLGFVGLWLLKRSRWGGRMRCRPESSLQHIDSILLGPRNTLHLVGVGDRRFLVAVDPRGVSRITVVAEDFPNLEESLIETIDSEGPSDADDGRSPSSLKHRSFLPLARSA